jgi:HEAT repeat protein
MTSTNEADLDELIAALAWEDRRAFWQMVRRSLHLREAAIAPLVARLGDADELVRAHAAEALGAFADPNVIDALGVALLQDRSSEVRFRAAMALEAIHDRRALDLLTAALRDRDPLVRGTAALMIGRFGEAHTTDSLIARLADPDATVRHDVAEALGYMKAAAITAVEALIGALDDDDVEVRGAAAIALGGIGDARALPRLERARHHDTGVTYQEGSIARAAADAIAQILAGQKR